MPVFLGQNPFPNPESVRAGATAWDAKAEGAADINWQAVMTTMHARMVEEEPPQLAPYTGGAPSLDGPALLFPVADHFEAVMMGRLEIMDGHAFPPGMARILTGLRDEPATVLFLRVGAGRAASAYVGMRAIASTAEAAAEAVSGSYDCLAAMMSAAAPGSSLTLLTTRAAYSGIWDLMQPMHASFSLVGYPDASGWDADRQEILRRGLDNGVHALLFEATPFAARELSSAIQVITGQMATLRKLSEKAPPSLPIFRSAETGEEGSFYAERAECLLEHLLGKVEDGLREGMWRMALTGLAISETTARRVAAALQAAYAGEGSRPEPLRIIHHHGGAEIAPYIRAFRSPSAQCGVIPPLLGAALGTGVLDTPMPSSDAAVLIPPIAAPAEPIPETIEAPAVVETIYQGPVISLGAGGGGAAMTIPLSAFASNALLLGDHGMGKRHTIACLLDQIWCVHRTPFLAIEPSSRRFRALHALSRFEDMRIFTPGAPGVAPMRLNPFECPPGLDCNRHTGLLLGLLRRVFGIEPAAAGLMRDVFLAMYQARGWDIARGFHAEARPESPLPSLAWPVLSDFAHSLAGLNAEGYGPETMSTVIRLIQTLQDGVAGYIFDHREPFDDLALLARPAVVELEAMDGEPAKALLMGLLLIRTGERRQSEPGNSELRHVTILCEAERLFPPGDARPSWRERSLEGMFEPANAAGECFIFATASPAALPEPLLSRFGLVLSHRLTHAAARERLAACVPMEAADSGRVAALPCGHALVSWREAPAPRYTALAPLRLGGVVTDALLADESGTSPDISLEDGALEQTARLHSWDPAARSAVWAFALSALESPAAAMQGWELAVERLQTLPVMRGQAAARRSRLIWLLFRHAAGNALLTAIHPPHALPLAQTQQLLDRILAAAEAVRSGRNSAIAAQAGSFARRATEALLLRDGPFSGCGACGRKCLYSGLAATLVTSGAAETAYRQFAISKEPDRHSLRAHFLAAASHALPTADSEPSRGGAIRTLALCLFLHAAALCGDEPASAPAGALFGS